jgi:hypothetical protein
MDAVAAPDVAVLFLSAQTEAPPNFSITSQLQGRTDNLTRTDKFGHSQFNSFAFDGTTNIMGGKKRILIKRNRPGLDSLMSRLLVLIPGIDRKRFFRGWT